MEVRSAPSKAGVVEEQVGHGRDQEDGDRALGLDHLDPASGVEAGQVDAPQPQLHRVVDEGQAGEGAQRAGVEPAAAALAGGDRPEQSRRSTWRTATPLGARWCPRCRGCRPGRPRPGAPGRRRSSSIRASSQASTWDAARARRAPRRRASAGVDHHGNGGPPAPASPASWATRAPSATTARAPAVGQHAADLGRGQARVERHGHPTGPVDGGVGRPSSAGRCPSTVCMATRSSGSMPAATRPRARRLARRPTRRRSSSRRRRPVGGLVAEGLGHRRRVSGSSTVAPGRAPARRRRAVLGLHGRPPASDPAGRRLAPTES